MDEKEAKAYEEGRRASWLSIFGAALRALGYDEPEATQARWIGEREAIIAILRELCREFGDNDWKDDDYLSDVIERNLANYLWDKEE
jgi:hypothetical protein